MRPRPAPAPHRHRTGRPGSVNRLLRRKVLDVPIGGWPCEIEIEYAETFLPPGHIRLLAQNQPLAPLYALKEQLQRLWQPDSTFAAMAARLDD